MYGDVAETRPEEAAGWRELEHAVGRLLERHDELSRRAESAERRVAELEEALKAVSAGELDPSIMAKQLEALRDRSRQLEERLDEGRERAARVLARLRFVEEDR